MIAPVLELESVIEPLTVVGVALVAYDPSTIESDPTVGGFEAIRGQASGFAIVFGIAAGQAVLSGAAAGLITAFGAAAGQAILSGIAAGLITAFGAATGQVFLTGEADGNVYV